VEILRTEYDTGKSLWETKPQTMTIKVAEAHCLRRAFDICGVYTPDEMPEPEPMREVPAMSRPVSASAEVAPKPAPAKSTPAASTDVEVVNPQAPARAAIHDPAGGDPTTCGGCGCDIGAAPGGYIVPVEGHGWRCIPCRDQVLKAAAPEPTPEPAPAPAETMPARGMPEGVKVTKVPAAKPAKVPKAEPTGAVCESCGAPVSAAEEKTSRLFISKVLCKSCTTTRSAAAVAPDGRL
jgi:hypothetical protein